MSIPARVAAWCKQLEQGRALQGHAMPVAAQRRITYVQHHAVRRHHAPEQPVDARTERDRGVAKTQLRQHAEARGLQDETRTHGPRRLETFEDPDAMTLAMQQQCRARGRPDRSRRSRCRAPSTPLLAPEEHQAPQQEVHDQPREQQARLSGWRLHRQRATSAASNTSQNAASQAMIAQ
jgi:hypothetical protein